MTNKYTIIVEKKQIKIRINGLLHLSFLQEEFVGIQSWIKGYDVDRKYFVEITTKTTTITSEYDNLDKWTSILKLLDNTKLLGF